MGERIPDGIKIANVEVTCDGVFELSEGKRSHFVRRSSFGRIGVDRGFLSERAAPLLVVGALLTSVGAYVGVEAVSNAIGPDTTGAPREPRRLWGAITFGAVALGIAMLREGVRRGYYLRLEGVGRKHRLGMGATVDPTLVRSSLEQSAALYGYEVVVTDVQRLWPDGSAPSPYRKG